MNTRSPRSKDFRMKERSISLETHYRVRPKRTPNFFECLSLISLVMIEANKLYIKKYRINVQVKLRGYCLLFISRKKNLEMVK